MKCSFILLVALLTLSSMLFASEANSQNLDRLKIALHLKKAGIKESLLAVEKQSKINFSLPDDLLGKYPKDIQINTDEISVRQAIETILNHTDLQYRILNNFILIEPKPAPQVPGKITGKITDAKGEPLPGASIRIIELNQNFSNNADGYYSINVKPGTYSIEVKYMSYITQLKTAVLIEEGKSTAMDFILKEETGVLNEVVVTALGIKKEVKKLGYAVQEIKSEAISRVPTNNFATQLSGKVAGLTVFNSPNLMQQTKIELRGREPLIVIDGIPVNSNTYDINALDIESISVLKGATAAALYGSKGQNGAIQITTKSAGKETSIELSQRSIFRAGWIVFPKTQTQYGNGEQGKYAYFDGMGNGTFDNDFVWGPRMDVKDPSTASGYWETPQWDSPLDANGKRIPIPFISRGKNNLKNFLETGSTISNYASISSSNDKTSVRLGLGYDFTNGEVPSTELKNYNGTLNVTSQATDRLKLSTTLQFNKQDSPNFPRLNYGNTNILYGMLIWAGADVDMRDFKNYWKPGKENYEPAYFNYSWINNPYYMAYEQTQSLSRNKFFGVASADYQISNSFSATLRQSAEATATTNQMKYPYGYIGANAIKGNYELTDENVSEYNTDAFIKYASIQGKFGINAFVGGSVNFKQNTLHNSKTQGLQVPQIYNLSNSIGSVLSTNSLTQYARNSLFASADLSYDDAYFLSLTERVDVSSALPKTSNQYSYPSVSGSVILSKLLHMPSSSFLKVRGSWAMVRADLAPYQYASYYNPSIIYNGNNSVTYSPVLGNEQLRPQKTAGYELGTNASFFGGKLTVDLTAYRYVDSESIYDQNASLASGFTKYKINGNRFNRFGYEAIIGTNQKISSKVEWTSTVNWSLNRNKLAEIYGGADNLGGVKIGDRMDLYMTSNTMQKAPDGQLIIGANGLPIKDTELKTLGHIGADWTASWFNNFRLFKQFNFSFLLEGRVGGIDQANLNQQLWYSGAHPDAVGPDREAYARGEAYIAKGVNLVDGKYVPNTYKTTYKDFSEQYWYRMNGESNVFDLTFLKLREVSIGYDVPKLLLDKLRANIKGVSFSVVGSNLFIASAFPLSDPDIGNGGSNGNLLQFPSARNVGFNLNVKF
jgi:TonB-linked SusC/RagA family outer membrane protein